MSKTQHPPEGKSSGHDPGAQPDDTIYVNPSASGSCQTYHTERECRDVTPDSREKPFRHRPLSSEHCQRCQAIADGEASE